jgi:hypothetical protein
MTIVLKAVVAFRMARILELEPRLAYENNVKGIILFITLRIRTCFQIGASNGRYFFLSRIGIKINEAMINLALTRATGPYSGVATLINIKALPHRAPKKTSNTQYLNSISVNKKPPNKFGG